MELNRKHYKLHELEREIQTWLSVLDIWQNHISFLIIRLSSLKERKPDKITMYQTLQQQLSYFSEPLIADYKESLIHHLGDLKNRNNAPIGHSWLEEHHHYHMHIQQLKTEYLQMVHKVLESMEK